MLRGAIGVRGIRVMSVRIRVVSAATVSGRTIWGVSVGGGSILCSIKSRVYSGSLALWRLIINIRLGPAMI